MLVNIKNIGQVINHYNGRCLGKQHCNNDLSFRLFPSRVALCVEK